MWANGLPLREMFSVLFSLSKLKLVLVADNGGMEEGILGLGGLWCECSVVVIGELEGF